MESDRDKLRQEILAGTQPGFEGRFSVDWKRAGQVLSRYQLEDPYRYVLKWVQWAVRSGATEVRIGVSNTAVSVEHDGATMDSAATLASLYGSGDESHMHLSIGCFAVQRLRTRALLLQSGPHEEVLSGKRPPASPTARLPNRILALGLPWVSPDVDGLSLMLHPPLDGGKRPRWDFLSFLRPECALVRLHAQYAPVPVWLNGRPVNLPWFGLDSTYRALGEDLDIRSHPRLLNKRFWGMLGSGATSIPGPRSRAAGYFKVYRGHPDEPERMELEWLLSIEEIDNLWGRRPRLRLFGDYAVPYQFIGFYAPYLAYKELVWVKDGVVVERSVDKRGVPRGVSAVLAAASISTDLSQFALVHDEAYLRAVRRLITTFMLSQS